MKFRVIDRQTGQPAAVRKIILEEEWARGLIYCDMEGFAITEDGGLILLDTCGDYVECPKGRFRVEFDNPLSVPTDEKDNYILRGDKP